MPFQATGAGQGPAPAGAPAQGGATASGSQGQANSGGFNWGNYPGVPEEQRSLLEPHLREVQAYVTRLEQQLAPLKPLIEMGVEPESVQGLVAFAQAFDQNPLGTWLGMAQQLQDSGMIHQEMDLDQVAAASQGDFGEEEEYEEGEYEEDGEVDDRYAALEARIQEMEEAKLQEQQSIQQQRQERLLTNSIQQMKAKLGEAGFADDLMPADEYLSGQIIAHRGDVSKAIEALTGFRDNAVKSHVSAAKQKQPRQLELDRGVPNQSQRKRDKTGDSFKSASAAAENMLRQSRASAQAEGVGTE